MLVEIDLLRLRTSRVRLGAKTEGDARPFSPWFQVHQAADYPYDYKLIARRFLTWFRPSFGERALKSDLKARPKSQSRQVAIIRAVYLRVVYNLRATKDNMH